MWSRLRHRRLQALSLVALAALLTTSLCLGPLYQRSMEQALAASALDQATPTQRALVISSVESSLDDLETRLPAALTAYVEPPLATRAVPIVVTPEGRSATLTRLYAPDGICDHVRITRGACPTRAGEVAVSDADVDANGWSIGSRVRVDEQRESPDSEPGHGRVTVVGTYATRVEAWIAAPITGRAGTAIVDGSSSTPVTDDWLAAPDSFAGGAPARWDQPVSEVIWPLDRAAVGVDELVRIGPLARAFVTAQAESSDHATVRTDLPALAEQVATGRDQGRVTVVVLVAQLLVLVAVVLWMVLAAATDDRRRELALVRLRGGGRSGAARFLLAELLPVCGAGVLLGALVGPPLMWLVSRVVFPVPVRHELPTGFLLAALGAALAVVLVVVVAALRAAREPVDSLLRGVRAPRAGAAGIGEVVALVFSLTAVVALLTGNLSGPLATLAPTLLALAAGLALGRALGPVTRGASGLLLARGRAVAAAGILNAVRRPSARRVLVMVIVAAALVVFCCDALVTGRHNRENAAEQANGAPYVLAVQAQELRSVVDAVDAADPGHRHLTPVVTTRSPGTAAGPTVAVDPAAFARVALFPLGRPAPGGWGAIRAPRSGAVMLSGTRIAGVLDGSEVQLRGFTERADTLALRAQLVHADGRSESVSLAAVPKGTTSTPVGADVDCSAGCVLTGLGLGTPPGLEVRGTLTLHDLTVDGRPVDLGAASGWRSTDDGTLRSTTDASGRFAVSVDTDGSVPPLLLSRWVPDPVPALVSSPEKTSFSASGLGQPTPMRVVGTLARVPGSAPGARVVDLAGLLRQPVADSVNAQIAVWGDDAAAIADVRSELARRGVTIASESTTSQVRARLDASPAAWSLALSVLVGGASVLVAALVMLVSTSTSWRARATDLAALRMAGLPGRSLRRMELLGQLPVVLVGGVVGVGCGVLAAVVALPGIRQFTDQPAVDTTDFSTRWGVVLLAAGAVVVVLGLLAVLTSRWTAGRARLERIREVG